MLGLKTAVLYYRPREVGRKDSDNVQAAEDTKRDGQIAFPLSSSQINAFVPLLLGVF